MSELAYTIQVIGRVQGVGFRYYTKQKADSLGIKGTVQNLNDGSVQIIAESEASIVNDFLEWCHQGPPTSEVERLNYTPRDIEDFADFKIIR